MRPMDLEDYGVTLEPSFIRISERPVRHKVHAAMGIPFTLDPWSPSHHDMLGLHNEEVCGGNM